jgi:hypothetical protein
MPSDMRPFRAVLAAVQRAVQATETGVTTSIRSGMRSKRLMDCAVATKSDLDAAMKVRLDMIMRVLMRGCDCASARMCERVLHTVSDDDDRMIAVQTVNGDELLLWAREQYPHDPTQAIVRYSLHSTWLK